jgi:hypothetical protein
MLLDKGALRVLVSSMLSILKQIEYCLAVFFVRTPSMKESFYTGPVWRQWPHTVW